MLSLTHRYVFAVVLLHSFAMGAQVAPTTPSQQAGAPQTLKVSTRIVVLDVVVTDKEGTLVSRELMRDDFTVLEDGQQQTIRSFDPPSAHRMPVSQVPIVN